MNDARKPPLGNDPEVFDPDDEFLTDPDPWASQSSAQLTNFLHKYAETAFIVIVLVILVVTFHWVPDDLKIASLNFFYLPVLTAGYLLGIRGGLISGVLCAVVILIYYLWVWSVAAAALGTVVSFRELANANQETLLQVAIWAGFMILVGGAFGRVNEHVMSSYKYVQKLRKEIRRLKEKGKTEG